MKNPEEKANINIDIGLGGIFKGIGSILELAQELAEKAPTEVKREDEVKSEDKGLHAVYGFSVRVGGAAGPTVQHFGNVKEEAKGPVVDDVREPMVDVFDEGEFIQIIAEMPGVDQADAKYEIKADILIISGETGERKYYKELLLPAAVDEEKIAASSKNGILELKLWKAKQS